MSTTQLFQKLFNHVREDSKVVHGYGPAETTIDSTCHIMDRKSAELQIPMANHFQTNQCLILDEFQQSLSIGQEGELFVGGVGVFAGYLGRDDLIKKSTCSNQSSPILSNR